MLGRRSDVSDLMRSATILLHVARFEGTPNVVLEAQALGLPVVCTDTGAASECVVDGESGFVCRIGDADTLARRCIELLTDRDLRLRFSRRSPAGLMDRYGPEAAATRLLQLIDGP